MKKLVCSCLLFAGLTGVGFAAAAPKRLLVVTTSIGFRHSSIEITEKVLRELAQKSGDFTIISTMDHPDYPDYTTTGAFGRQVGDGTPAQITYIRKLNDRINSPLAPLQAKLTDATAALTTATFDGNSAARAARVNDLGAAELALALAKADAFAGLQRPDLRLSPQQLEVFLGRAQSPAAPRTTFAPQVGAATPAQQKAIAAANASPAMTELHAALTKARADLQAASLILPRDANALRTAADAVAAAETSLAAARANEFARIQSTAGRFAPAVVKTLVSRFALPETGTAANDGAAKVFADMLSVEALKNYDGVMFVSTVGALPFPDLDGFIKWVNDGGAWLGTHAASDSMHGVTKYFDLMGGEFTGHGSQTSELMTVQDTEHPIGKAIGSKTIRFYDEMYTFENANYDQSKVRTILDFTTALNDGMHTPVGAPGHWPSTWIKQTGKGRVFYTALGHREDVVDPNYNLSPRMNPPETAQAFQRMLHAGVRWGLGLIDGDATPQVKVPTPAGGAGVARAGRGAVPAGVAIPGAPAAPAAP